MPVTAAGVFSTAAVFGQEVRQKERFAMSASRPPEITHQQFLLGAALLEGSLVVVAFMLGWLVSVSPTSTLAWNLTDLGLGMLAAGPLLALLAVCYLLPGSGLRQIREFMRDTLGPFLARCRIIDLLLLAVLAGVCEEILFRGLLFLFFRQFNMGLAVIVSSVTFGMAHMVTPLYAFLAGMAGLYLTALLAVDPEANLLLPIAAHAAYDFVAFLVVVHDFRKKRGLRLEI